MPLSLPGILAAVHHLRLAVAVSPPDRRSAEARDHAVEVRRAIDGLRRTLTPSNPDWRHDDPDDLHDPGFSPALAQHLRYLWHRIVRTWRVPPPFSPEERDEWLMLLDRTAELVEFAESRSSKTVRRRKDEDPAHRNACDRCIIKACRAGAQTGKVLAKATGYGHDYIRARARRLVRLGKLTRTKDGYVPTPGV